MTQNVEHRRRPARRPRSSTRDPAAAEDYEVGLKSLNQWQLAWRKFQQAPPGADRPRACSRS